MGRAVYENISVPGYADKQKKARYIHEDDEPIAATFELDELVALFSTSEEGTLSAITCDKIQSALNKAFPDKECSDVIFTKNVDHLFFGVYVNPTVTSDMTLEILNGDEPVVIDRYSVEIDSKMFDVGLTPEEMVAFLLYEVSSMVSSGAPVEEVRHIIDQYLANEDLILDIQASANYIQLFTFAIKDALRKVSSIMFKDNDGVLANAFINSLDLQDTLVSALNKVRSSVFGVGAEVKEPNLVLIGWVFAMYEDIKSNANSAIYTLDQAKLATGSKLQQFECDKAIKSLQRVGYDVTVEATNLLTEAKKKRSLFAGLKSKGLRSIEDDLYELSIRAKNADTEEDAFYTLRQINSRLGILQDYLEKTEVSQAEEDHWRDVMHQYQELRALLSKKKISSHAKNYGIFFDYDQLDDLD